MLGRTLVRGLLPHCAQHSRAASALPSWLQHLYVVLVRLLARGGGARGTARQDSTLGVLITLSRRAICHAAAVCARCTAAVCTLRLKKFHCI